MPVVMYPVLPGPSAQRLQSLTKLHRHPYSDASSPINPWALARVPHSSEGSARGAVVRVGARRCRGLPVPTVRGRCCDNARKSKVAGAAEQRCPLKFVIRVRSSWEISVGAPEAELQGPRRCGGVMITDSVSTLPRHIRLLVLLPGLLSSRQRTKNCKGSNSLGITRGRSRALSSTPRVRYVVERVHDTEVLTLRLITWSRWHECQRAVQMCPDVPVACEGETSSCLFAAS